MKKLNVNQAKEVFEAIVNDVYSPLWELIDDFEVNNHIVSLKRSKQFGELIIDNCYESCNNYTSIQTPGGTMGCLEYLIKLLEQ